MHATLEAHSVGSSPNNQNLFSSFDVDCEEVPSQRQMELVDLQGLEDLKTVLFQTIQFSISTWYIFNP